MVDITNQAAPLAVNREQEKIGPVAVSKAPPPPLSEVPKPWAVQVISLSTDKTDSLAAIKRRVESMGYEAYIAEVNGAKKVQVGP